jgi:hypothetical protein
MHGELPMAGRTGVKSGGEPHPCPPRDRWDGSEGLAHPPRLTKSAKSAASAKARKL